MRGEGKVNPCTDLPLRADPIPCFVGAKHPETAEPVNQHISCRMLRPYRTARSAVPPAGARNDRSRDEPDTDAANQNDAGFPC